MNFIQRAVTVFALAVGLAAPFAVGAQTAAEHQHATDPEKTAALTDGEVRKVDVENGKLTLKHGPIPHLDMPGMTMVFTVKGKDMLRDLKPGDKVRFMAVRESGKVIVTEVQIAR